MSEAEKEGKKNGSGGVRHDVHLMGDPPAGHHDRAGTVEKGGTTGGPWREPVELGGPKATRGRKPSDLSSVGEANSSRAREIP
jgi:hypothetical protein